ncbi:MAG: glutamate-5-semialdehyde dehydrogenase [Candidatus Poribacteria bacterium]|nr:glutamate-5-semialdehyde dehydrogenase [Candidatus Poribacteria bacterium]
MTDSGNGSELAQKAIRQMRMAKEAARQIAVASTEQKNEALKRMAALILENRAFLAVQNKKDLEAGRENGLSSSLLDRLELTDARIDAMADGLRQVADLPDPVGRRYDRQTRPNGLVVEKERIPLGVIGIIYESRPNVTADAAGLCFKSGNAVVLRGGSEAIHSNAAIAELLQNAVEQTGLSKEIVQFINTTDREAVNVMLKQDALIDVIIPRGGKGLIRHVAENSTIPVIKHEDGICHTYVDETADLQMAETISLNAKVQRPSVCNAMETLLAHASIAEAFLPSVCEKMAAAGVELRGCERSRQIVSGMKPASEEDWRTEYHDLILSIRVVDSLEEAVEHIETYGSHHSDAIVTRDEESARRFTQGVDSSSVFVNASTRFADGYEYGLGAEIGISTQKLHARGPMGLEELTIYKFIALGDGHIRE